MQERLKTLRETLGYSQAAFAKQISMNPSNYCRAEKGKREIADYYVELICLKFNVNKEWLLQGVGEMLIPPSQNEQEIAEKFLMHKISQLPEGCKKELLGFCARLLKAESKKI